MIPPRMLKSFVGLPHEIVELGRRHHMVGAEAFWIHHVIPGNSRRKFVPESFGDRDRIIVGESLLGSLCSAGAIYLTTTFCATRAYRPNPLTRSATRENDQVETPECFRGPVRVGAFSSLAGSSDGGIASNRTHSKMGREREDAFVRPNGLAVLPAEAGARSLGLWVQC